MRDYEVVRKLFETIANDRALRKVTAYVDPKHTLKISRTRPVDLRNKNETYVLTVGVPNYVERIFISDCVAAGERFPVKKVQLQYWPKKR